MVLVFKMKTCLHIFSMLQASYLEFAKKNKILSVVWLEFVLTEVLSNCV